MVYIVVDIPKLNPGSLNGWYILICTVKSTSSGRFWADHCRSGVDFLAFPPINIGERYKKIFDLRKVISQSEIPFDLKQLHQLSVGL